MSDKTKGAISAGSRPARRPAEDEAAAVPATAGPREVVNDATGYGVQIQPASVAPGTAVLAGGARPSPHAAGERRQPPHLSGRVRRRRRRARRAVRRARSTARGCASPGTAASRSSPSTSRPTSPGTNFPMWKWQVCAVECLGLAGQGLASDRVIGLHTGHPDEAPGNTLFHHSFGVTSSRRRRPTRSIPTASIYGVIHNGSGRTAVLLRRWDRRSRRKTLGGRRDVPLSRARRRRLRRRHRRHGLQVGGDAGQRPRPGRARPDAGPPPERDLRQGAGRRGPDARPAKGSVRSQSSPCPPKKPISSGPGARRVPGDTSGRPRWHRKCSTWTASIRDCGTRCARRGPADPALRALWAQRQAQDPRGAAVGAGLHPGVQGHFRL